ncbi:MAG: zf-HC2 domain-containing protein [Elusimicrobiota bacterium]
MASCEKILHSIWEYLDGETTVASKNDVDKHLELCRGCFSRFEFEKTLREQMKNKTFKSCPESIKKKIQDLIKRY